ncbi:MAG: hypothetical protein KatS3mg020_0676 [Fimbriimonadales bacterium]|nr:MAG: hypothetical protein KatS3mg020_0676 [Fimbriimonadales bacterium]
MRHAKQESAQRRRTILLMTPFLQRVVRFLRENPEGVQIVRRVSTEDTIEPPEEEGGFSRAMLVHEPDRREFGVFPVPPADEPTQFTHFIDGIQHSHLLYYQQTAKGLLPVVYGYVAAMVLERRDRALHPASDLTESEEALYLPLKAFDARKFKRADVRVYDSLEERELEKTSFSTMLVRAGATVARVRDHLERKLALQWIEQQTPASNDWLLVDGSIADLMSALEQRRLVQVVGVSKSHRTSYLEINWMLQVLNMPAGYRSSVFRPVREGQSEVYSWYLRLRWQAGASPTYGLVRVETPVLTSPDDTREWADKISAWLLQETRPLSLPDPRYDRLLYPFRLCEQHLRSRAPSDAVMRTATERVGDLSTAAPEPAPAAN